MNTTDIPKQVWDVLKEVELFSKDLTPEPRADPMICDANIKMSPEEMEFLRQHVDLVDFQIQLERMIAKEKYGSGNKDEEKFDSGINCSESDDDDNDDTNLGLGVLADRVAAEAAMIYVKREK